MSVLELIRIEGLTLHVRGLDILDATPVLDIKPYVPYADVRAQAGSGWLEQDALAPRDPGPSFPVRFDERAEEQLQWLAARTAVDLRGLAMSTLALGPAPHPYRRIRAQEGELLLGLKDFRLRFEARDGEIRGARDRDRVSEAGAARPVGRGHRADAARRASRLRGALRCASIQVKETQTTPGIAP